MRAGKLRHRVQLQEAVEPKNSYGETKPEWKTIATVWAEVSPLQGRERFTAQQVQSEVTHNIRIRYREVKAKQRFLFGQRVFNIDSILNRDERNIEITVLAIEEVP